MPKCRVCEKELYLKTPRDDVELTCGSCLLLPTPPPEGRKLSKKKTSIEFAIGMKQLFGKTNTYIPAEEGVMLKIKSNSVRNGPLPFTDSRGGRLYLHFDQDGYATVPEHHREEIERYMATRPGRLKIVEELQPPPPPAPVKVLAPAPLPEPETPKDLMEKVNLKEVEAPKAEAPEEEVVIEEKKSPKSPIRRRRRRTKKKTDTKE